MTAWSYSRVNDFIKCPKKYYHLHVKKDFKFYGNSATRYGNAVHRAAEHYIKSGTELEKQYEFTRPVLDAFNRIKGEKLTELRMAVTKSNGEYAPTKWGAKDVWYRGIADLLIINGTKAFVIDYKTSKSADYADMKQLDLLAGAVFVHFPEVTKIKGGLSFLCCDAFIKKEYTSDLYKSYISVFDGALERIEVAKEENVWNAVESGLCGFCPVTSCEHNRG